MANLVHMKHLAHLSDRKGKNKTVVGTKYFLCFFLFALHIKYEVNGHREVD